MTPMLKKASSLSLALLLAAGAGLAQAADKLSPAQFVDDASAKGIAEIEAGKLALDKSQSQDIKSFAQQMIDDHTKANEQLKSLAQQKKLEVSSDAELMDKAKAMILQVRDDSFDRSYANNQVMAHEQTIAIFRTEAETSKDAELKAFAQKTLPTLEHHLQEAKALQSKYAKK
ncbi:membrane protein [Pseudomonas oryzihabitans]|nr:membrane protein [Pseudomonas psychrotolerans]KTT42426.1 membrane protein [Pseudomonas psychrotolerans]